MALTCGKCSRVNPPDASYCYFDGALLNGHGADGGPAGVGKRPFPTEFVFPSGRACRTFDELALAVQSNWQEVRDLLRQGIFESFFGTLGRADLVLAAREAGKFPDRDRGLDQLLAKLPSQVLDAPKLRAEPLEVSLGVLRVGQDRGFDLRLENQGSRLLYGSVTCGDCAWLAVGEGQGTPDKMFELTNELVLPVHVKGQKLRAGNKPQEGRLLVESNGGTVQVVVRAEVPVKPFPDGVLAGAKAPRQIAEKAKAAPKEAALLFEKGAVAGWYKDNGWTYPVQAPSASGLGAVQQFFEALGLTAPPKVEISDRALSYDCNPGDSLRHVLEVKTPEKRPVWAHAVSDQPWCEVGRAKLNGRTATIGIAVPSVPNRPGETLTARVTVTANGNQRFVVPVTLRVAGGFQFADPPLDLDPIANAVQEPAVVAPAAQPFEVAPVVRRDVRRGNTGGWVHALPAALLAVVVGTVVAVDVASAPKKTENKTPEPEFSEKDPFEGVGGPSVKDPFGWYRRLADTKPHLGIGYNEKTSRFGMVNLDEPDPKNPKKFKRLTSLELGTNNNTCVRIDNSEHIFGREPGSLRNFKRYDPKKEPPYWRAAWEWKEGVQVTQLVMLVPGERGLLDTCFVRYTVENKAEVPKTVGLRVMLDTLIGDEDNDGVPFSVPGREPPLVQDLAVLEKHEIPDYIQVLENPDPAKPGTVAHLGLKVNLPDVQLEPLLRVVLCQWPVDRGSEVRWTWQFEPIDKNPAKKDSCVVLYWPEVRMQKGEKQEVAFTYGLNAVNSDLGGGTQGPRLALYAPKTVKAGDEFTVTGYVKRPVADQKIKLDVPDGFSLAGGSAEQDVPQGGSYSQVSWKVKAGGKGDHRLKIVHGSAEVSREITVTNDKKSIFD